MIQEHSSILPRETGSRIYLWRSCVLVVGTRDRGTKMFCTSALVFHKNAVRMLEARHFRRINLTDKIMRYHLLLKARKKQARKKSLERSSCISISLTFDPGASFQYVRLMYHTYGYQLKRFKAFKNYVFMIQGL